MAESETKISDEFWHRVCKTRLSPLSITSGTSLASKKYSEIRNLYPGVELDIAYENLRPIVVLVFETPEDCLDYTLKFGKDYGI